MAVATTSKPLWARVPALVLIIQYPLIAALVALFLGERVLGETSSPRMLLSGVGLIGVLGVTGLQAWHMRKASGDRRRTARLMLVGHVGCLLAVLLYIVSANDWMGWLGIDFSSAESKTRYQDMLSVLWPMLMFISLLPTLLAQTMLNAADESDDGSGNVEWVRVAELASSGLTIALAGSMLFMVCYIASERNEKVDVSYFKTSAPGTATQKMVDSLNEPLVVHMFFPEVNEVKEELLAYFNSLAKLSGKVQIKMHDRLLNPKVAKEFRVTRDGAVVLARGEQHETLSFNVEINTARGRLRKLDEEMQRTFMKIVRKPRIAYVTTGHGEINDPASQGPMSASPLGNINAVKQVLSLLNYTVKNLGGMEGLAERVPDDATMVLSFGPKNEFSAEETASLKRYLEGGGSVLLALDPENDVGLGELEPVLGVHYDRTQLADDKDHMRTPQGGATDNRLIKTDRFSAHAAVTTLSSAPASAFIFVVGAGSFSDVTLPPQGAPKRTPIVRTGTSAFADKNGGFQFDADEKRQSYNLAMAVEKGIVGTAKKKDKESAKSKQMRALLFADAGMFTDGVLVDRRGRIVGYNSALVLDSVKWLGGEETFSGTTVDEQDNPIVHTEKEDKAWFYSTILGAPTFVLIMGMVVVGRRRRPRGKKA